MAESRPTFALVGPVYPYRGGIAHYTTLLTRALRASHHAVLLVSFKRQYPQWLFPGRSDKDPSRQPLAADDPHYWLDSLNPFTWLLTFRRIRQARPDVLVLQWWTPFWTPVWLTLLAANRLLPGSRVCVICHNVLPHETKPWSPWIARLVLQWADLLIVQSEAEYQQVNRLLPDKRTVIVPHPVYDMFAEQRVPKHAARARLGLPADEPILLFFGIVRAYKGLPRLLRALPLVRRTVPDARLVIAGDFWDDERDYRALIDDLGLGAAVTIDNRYVPNEEVAVYFSAADLLVAPYEHITGSGVVRMAEGFGLPAVTTGAAGRTSPLATNGMAGDDGQGVADLAAAIVQALEAPPQIDPSASPMPNPWGALVEALASAAVA